MPLSQIYKFQSTRPSRASTPAGRGSATQPQFQSTRPSRASTYLQAPARAEYKNFNPQGPRGPRRRCSSRESCGGYFNPQGPRGPRLVFGPVVMPTLLFQSTRPSRASTSRNGILASLRPYFNPQGPRGPRPKEVLANVKASLFQSTRPSRASTLAASWAE